CSRVRLSSMRRNEGSVRIRRLAIAATICGALAVWSVPGGASSQDATVSQRHREVLDTYCVTCHNQRLDTAGLALETLDLSQVADRADVWEKVVRKLRAGVMPPQGARRPDQATADALAAWLERELDRAAASKPRPGRS